MHVRGLKCQTQPRLTLNRLPTYVFHSRLILSFFQLHQLHHRSHPIFLVLNLRIAITSLSRQRHGRKFHFSHCSGTYPAFHLLIRPFSSLHRKWPQRKELQVRMELLSQVIRQHSHRDHQATLHTYAICEFTACSPCADSISPAEAHNHTRRTKAHLLRVLHQANTASNPLMAPRGPKDTRSSEAYKLQFVKRKSTQAIIAPYSNKLSTRRTFMLYLKTQTSLTRSASKLPERCSN